MTLHHRVSTCILEKIYRVWNKEVRLYSAFPSKRDSKCLSKRKSNSSMVGVHVSFRMSCFKKDLAWPSRMSDCIPMTISFRIFSGTGCRRAYTSDWCVWKEKSILHIPSLREYTAYTVFERVYFIYSLWEYAAYTVLDTEECRRGYSTYRRRLNTVLDFARERRCKSK